VRKIKVLNKTRERILGDRIGLADRYWSRVRGLLGRGGLDEGQGLLLTPCKAVHTHGMRMPIDVAFLDRHGVVLALYPALERGRRTAYHKEAASALELPAGTLSETGTAVGDLLTWLTLGRKDPVVLVNGNNGRTQDAHS
jgi:uncharacterized membrane protein (UPF0127 family)